VAVLLTRSTVVGCELGVPAEKEKVTDDAGSPPVQLAINDELLIVVGVEARLTVLGIGGARVVTENGGEGHISTVPNTADTVILNVVFHAILVNEVPDGLTGDAT
jgi:hypothetical protein